MNDCLTLRQLDASLQTSPPPVWIPNLSDVGGSKNAMQSQATDRVVFDPPVQDQSGYLR